MQQVQFLRVVLCVWGLHFRIGLHTTTVVAFGAVQQQQYTSSSMLYIEKDLKGKLVDTNGQVQATQSSTYGI